MWAFLVFARVVEEQACCGRVCLVGGGVWCLRLGCVRLLVFALLVLARFGGVVGAVWSLPPLSRLAWLRVHALVLACWRVRGLCARWAEGGQVGAGHGCPAPYCVACGARLLCAGKGRRVGGEGESAPQGGEQNPLALAYVGTGAPLSVLNRVGVEPRGADRVGLAGRRWRAAVVACSLAWCIQSPLLVAGGWCRWWSGASDLVASSAHPRGVMML